MQKTNVFYRLAKGLLSSGAILTNITLVAMMLIIIVNVALRYFFKTPLYWGDSTMVYMMIVMVYLGAGDVMINNGNIRINALLERLPPKVQRILDCITGCIGIVCIGIFIYAFTPRMLSTYRMGSVDRTTDWPLFPWQAGLLFGVILLFIATVWTTIRRFRVLTAGEKEPKKTVDSVKTYE